MGQKRIKEEKRVENRLKKGKKDKSVMVQSKGLKT
jgi:hypothetical protein